MIPPLLFPSPLLSTYHGCNFLLPKRHPLHTVVLGFLPVGIMSFLRSPSCPHLIILRTHYYRFWGDGHWSRLSWTACTISDLVPIPSHLFPTFISTTFSHLESQPNVSSIVASFSTFYDLSTPFPIHTRSPCVFSFPHLLPSAIRWLEAVPGTFHCAFARTDF